MTDDDEDALTCATCGRPLGGDPEDEPDGDAGLPICGECNRGRNFDALMLDGVLTVARASVMIMAMDTETRYSLADLARVVGVTPRTVRYYIVQGLLPGANDSGPAAWYDERHLGRLRLIRELQRQHLPLAEIRSRLAELGEVEVSELLEAQATRPAATEGSALDYIRAVLGSGGQAPRSPQTSPPPLMRVAASTPAPSMWARASTPGVLASEPAPGAAADAAVAPPPPASAPTPPAPTAERSQWDRIALTNDIELHVRRPLSRLDNRRVERLITIARQVLGEEQP